MQCSSQFTRIYLNMSNVRSTSMRQVVICVNICHFVSSRHFVSSSHSVVWRPFCLANWSSCIEQKPVEEKIQTLLFDALVVVNHDFPSLRRHEAIWRGLSGTSHSSHLCSGDEEEVVLLLRVIEVHCLFLLVVRRNTEWNDLQLGQSRSHGENLKQGQVLDGVSPGGHGRSNSNRVRFQTGSVDG